mgnify:FL=1
MPCRDYQGGNTQISRKLYGYKNLTGDADLAFAPPDEFP